MQNFSLKRLALLIKKIWVENYRIWGMSLAVLVALYVVFHFLTTNRTHIIAFYPRQLIYSIGLIISGTIFANFLWRDLSNKNQSINFLLLPATPFEKLLAGMFYAVIFFPAVYISCFFILDFLYIETIKSITTVNIDAWDLRPLSLSDTNSIVLPTTLLCLIIQPIALMSSLLFEKFSYVKTALLLVGFLILIIYVFGTVKHIILKDALGERQLSGSLFTPTEINVNTPEEYFSDTIRVPAPVSLYLNLFMTLGITLFFMLVTFLKLKEKEI